MKTIKTRFGDIQYDPDKVLHFPQGMIGFENLHNFIVMPNKKKGPLFWIQSVDDPDIAFIVTDPTNFFLDYKVVPESSECTLLDAQGPEEVYILSVVTVTPEKEITLNLAAPIMFNPSTNKAIQVILEGTSYSSKTPLPNK